MPANHSAQHSSARERLITAAHAAVRTNGYAATSVSDLCALAGVTKGAFFHHFPTKEALGVAAADAWTARAQEHIFTRPEWTQLPDPLDRVLAHIDLRMAMIEGPVADFTCFVGTMVQEAYLSNQPIRAACSASIRAYAERLAIDIQAAIDRHRPASAPDALGLAYHIQAVLQGAFVLAKAQGDVQRARQSVAHVRRYIELVFAIRAGEGNECP